MIGLSSCEDFLDRAPLSDLAPETYFQDKAEMSNWNIGIYDAFRSALYQKQIVYGDIRSDNCETTSYAQNWIYMNALEPTQSLSSWADFYYAISRANTGIEKYPTIPGILESEYAPYMGQAYGMRALMYFWGTRVWGKMPIVTSTWNGDLENMMISRSSLEEVKTQIYSDIDKAIEYFKITNTSSKFELSLAAMYALRVEADLWYKQYQDALDDSEYFIDNSNYELVEGETEWKNIFVAPDDSKEVIFAMDWDYAAMGANSGWPGQLGASNTNNGWQISEKLLTEFIDRKYSGEGADSRFWNTLDTVKLYYNGGRYPLVYANYSTSGIQKCIKYSSIDPKREFDSSNQVYKSQYAVLNTNDCEQKLVMSRMANIMLLRAEALNQLGRGEEALDIVNRIRNRSGYLKDAKTEVNASIKTDVETVILLERQLEFYGEGQRWFDLMRTNRLEEVMGPIYSQRQMNAGVTVTGFGHEGTKYWPIFYKEFESNTALAGDQNQPYTER